MTTATATKAKPSANGKKGGNKDKKAQREVQFLKLGKAELIDVPLKSCTFDRRLQQRKAMYDDEVVADYVWNYQNGVPMPPGKAVRETIKEDGKADRVVYWVYNGFQRGKALQDAGMKSYPLEVIDGTFADAFFLSLSANQENGLRRNVDDQRRAVLALLNEPSALEIVTSKVEKGFDLSRALAQACGVALGTVSNALEEAQLSVKGKTLVPRDVKPAKKPKPVPAPTPDVKPEPPAKPTPEVSAAQQKIANDAAFKEIQRQAFKLRLEECFAFMKKMSTRMATLIGDQEHGETVRKILADHDFPVAKEYLERLTEKDFTPYIEIHEHWDVASRLGEMLLEIKEATKSKPVEGDAGDTTTDGSGEGAGGNGE